jgi:hypothetical protein
MHPIRALRFLSLATFAALLPALLPAQGGIYGNVQCEGYFSPTGTFTIKIPVLPELGGSLNDTPTVVTFQDQFTLHASIACFRMDATQRWEHSTRGTRDYLVWFFGNFVQTDFRERFPDARIQSASFLPGVATGTLLVYNLLPGGTMFPDRVAFADDQLVPVAKRGNLVFVHDEHIYVISTELAERVIQARTWNKTTAEEDAILSERLLKLLRGMAFTTPLPAAPVARS